jgi:Bacterial Ig-like domain
MRRTIMTMNNTDRFGVLVLATAAVLAASLLLAPGKAHAYEVHVSISGAGSVTETTPADLLRSNCWSPSATPTGTVATNCYPGEPDGPYGWGWVVRYEAHPAPGYQFWKWDSDGGPDPVICDGSFDAQHTGSVCQFATFGNLQTRAFFRDEYPPVEANITSGPTQPAAGPATFVYHLAVEWYGEPPDPTFERFECRVQREDRSTLYDWQPCGTNQGHGSLTVDPPEDGLYRFDVRAVDYSGNVSFAGPRSYLWTVDKTSPQTSLDPTVGPVEGSVGKSDSVSFEFSTNDESSFQCQLDTGSWQPCDSPYSLSNLDNGNHTFRVKAVDTAGNEDETPAERHWTVDTTAPVILDAVTPASSTTEVARNTNVTATFSEEMDETTLTTSTFQLYQGQWTRVKKKKKGKKHWVWVYKWVPVSASVSCDSPCKTATLDPTSDLAANTTYLAVVTTGAKDWANTALAKNHSWTFTTGAT